jgi:hypothetical protein
LVQIDRGWTPGARIPQPRAAARSRIGRSTLMRGGACHVHFQPDYWNKRGT